MPLLLAVLGIAGPLALKTIAVIAAKALLISKIALTIAGVIGFRKLYSNEQPDLSGSADNRRHTIFNRPSNFNKYHIKTPAAAALDPYRYYNDYTSNHQ